jgi:16S rRNA (guanine527-N7)-methyltransferase
VPSLAVSWSSFRHEWTFHVKRDVDQSPLPVPAAPSGAAGVFGQRFALAEAFAAMLADTGVRHGLIGPREVPRLWERHILNCAVVSDAYPQDARLIDVGSGAGLPGVALAVVRPDLDVHLIEPMLRRTTWLDGVVRDLSLDNVTVHRGRAEDMVGVLSAPFVTARAVARLDKLAPWCVPMLDQDGALIAMKGRTAVAELAEDRPTLDRLGLVEATVVEHGTDVLDEPVLTVDLRFGRRRSQDRRHVSSSVRRDSRRRTRGPGGNRRLD